VGIRAPAAAVRSVRFIQEKNGARIFVVALANAVLWFVFRLTMFTRFSKTTVKRNQKRILLCRHGM